MRIGVVATGSRGDVQPYVALGKGLVRAGHAVRLVTNSDYEAFVTGHGLEFWPLPGHVRQIAQGKAMRDRLASGDFVKIIRQMAVEAEQGAADTAKAALAACRGMDAVLAGIGGIYFAIAVAERLSIPAIQAYYIPFQPTRAAPSFVAAAAPIPIPTVLNRLTHRLARQMMWQGFRKADSIARREALGLPPAPIAGPFGSRALKGTPTLYAYSPSVIPKPADWGEDVHVTGYWFLEEDDWDPPASLIAFLAAGPAPVYVGFGSMASSDPKATADLVLEALSRNGQRGVLLGGWGGLEAEDVRESVYLLDGAPFSWLFPRMAAVVHHGGAGTTAAGLRAGVPSVVVPFFGDQPYWAQRVVRLGVGPKAAPRRKLTVDQLAAAIEVAITDQRMRQRAADLGARIGSEDGVGNAVAALEGWRRAHLK